MNKLNCSLCLQSYQQPHMCPHCSQVYCHKCIKQYLQKYYFCPSCDKHIIDLVDCSRLINQVKQKIKQSDLRKQYSLNHSNKQICLQHNFPLNYYCNDCKINICSDCGLIQQKVFYLLINNFNTNIQHKNHQIRALQTNKQQKLFINLSQLKQIKKIIKEKINKSMEDQKKLLLQIQLLKSQIKYNKTKIYEYYQELILKLQKQSKTILVQIQMKIKECNKIIEEKRDINKKIEYYQKTNIQNFRSEMNRNIEQQKVQINDKELVKYLLDNKMVNLKNTINNRGTSLFDVNYPKMQQEEQSVPQLLNNLSFLDKQIYQLSIMKQIHPEYHNFSFQFDYLLQKDTQIIYSQNYQIYGYQWRLKIYPRGNFQVHNKYLSIFLQLVDSPQKNQNNIMNIQKQYYFRLQLLNLNMAGLSIIKQYNSKFSVGQCWGYAQFMSIYQISDYLHQGKLLFVMGVRNISYYDQCQNMKKYIKKLEGQNKVLSELCQSYYAHNNRNEQQSIDNSSMSNENQYNNLRDQVSSIISSVQDYQAY